MNTQTSNGFDGLERIFHEPNRMAILSVLCTKRDGFAFTELRDRCGLTDGNLSRHLKTLEDGDIVSCRKAFVHDKPKTTVRLTAAGTRRFRAYLDTLTDILKQTKADLVAESHQASVTTTRLKPV